MGALFGVVFAPNYRPTFNSYYQKTKIQTEQCHVILERPAFFYTHPPAGKFMELPLESIEVVDRWYLRDRVRLGT